MNFGRAIAVAGIWAVTVYGHIHGAHNVVVFFGYLLAIGALLHKGH
jgi:hypothetical protein